MMGIRVDRSIRASFVHHQGNRSPPVFGLISLGYFFWPSSLRSQLPSAAPPRSFIKALLNFRASPSPDERSLLQLKEGAPERQKGKAQVIC